MVTAAARTGMEKTRNSLAVGWENQWKSPLGTA